MKRLMLVSLIGMGLAPVLSQAQGTAGEVVVAPNTVTLIEQVVPEEATDLGVVETQRVSCPLPAKYCKGRVEELSAPTTTASASTTQLTVQYTEAGYTTTQVWEKQLDAGSGEVSWRLLSTGSSVASATE